MTRAESRNISNKVKSELNKELVNFLIFLASKLRHFQIILFSNRSLVDLDLICKEYFRII